MKKNEICYAYANKKPALVGFRRCQPLNKEEVAGLSDEILPQSVSEPVLCFGESSRDVEYDVSAVYEESGRLRTSPEDHWLRISTDCENSLSMLFANLNTPDDVFRFATLYGHLFNDASLNELEEYESYPIDCDSLSSMFSDSDEAVLSSEPFASERAVFFEELSGWLIAIQLLRAAFAFSAFLESANLLVAERGDGSISLSLGEEATSDIRLYSAGEGHFGVVLDDLEGFSLSKLDTVSYMDNLKTRSSRFPNSELEAEPPFDARLYEGDWGGLRLVVGVSEADAAIEMTARAVLENALGYLVYIHEASMRFLLVKSKIRYRFNSLLSYLWFDFASVTNGSIQYASCYRCGAPFFRINKGHKKKYCSEACRYKARDDRKKEERLKKAGASR